MTLAGFLFAYILGGLTFIPLIIAAVAYYVFSTLPKRDLYAEDKHGEDGLRREGDRADVLKSELDNLPEELRPKAHLHEADVAAGYFAVCREYVPGGVNGRPPERTTPSGTGTIANESPSVYQSMYRSLFDRTKGQPPTMDTPKGPARTIRRPRNVFFVVLRHGHLMLYDDEEQLEVRYVISLAHHNVDLYGGDDETILDGELFIKRNCIRLTRKQSSAPDASDSKPFYLFADNTSMKEDFYHALLQNCENAPTPIKFDPVDLVKLVQQLHASEDNLQTRWINALIGRLWLSLYKTSTVEDWVRSKITKKIARVQKPAFISSIKLEKVSMGDSGPFITNPKMRELSIDGNMVLEADIRYRGNFMLQLSAIARIELGSRMKAREVRLVLAASLKRLEGHLLIRVKPPPTNRIWISFETMPKIELSIEPILSQRQITYGFILRTIENRIKEVFAETLVSPNWDDIQFINTTNQKIRGGIWADDPEVYEPANRNDALAEQGLVDQVDGGSDPDAHLEAPPNPLMSKEKSMSMPVLAGRESPPSGLRDRKGGASSVSLDGPSEKETAASSGAELPSHTQKPKAMRSRSFAAAADPVVSVDDATVEALKAELKQGKNRQDAASAFKTISMRSQPTSPNESPVGSPPQQTDFDKRGSFASMASSGGEHTDGDVSGDDHSSGETKRDTESDAHDGSSVSSTSTSRTKGKPIANTINMAGSAAKKWFANRQEYRQQQQAAKAAQLATRSLAQGKKNQETEHDAPEIDAPVTPSVPSLQRKPSLSPASSTSSIPLAIGRRPIPSPKSSNANLHTLATDTAANPPHTNIPSPYLKPSTSQSSLREPSPPKTTGTSPKPEPMGRGQPLPPPGTPLPGPPKERKVWGAETLGYISGASKRKPILPPRPAAGKPPSSPNPNSSEPDKPDDGDEAPAQQSLQPYKLSPQPSHPEHEPTSRPRHYRKSSIGSTALKGSSSAATRNGAFTPDSNILRKGSISSRAVPPPPTPQRRKRSSLIPDLDEGTNEDIMIVEAPRTSNEEATPVASIDGHEASDGTAALATAKLEGANNNHQEAEAGNGKQEDRLEREENGDIFHIEQDEEPSHRDDLIDLSSAADPTKPSHQPREPLDAHASSAASKLVESSASAQASLSSTNSKNATVADEDDEFEPFDSNVPATPIDEDDVEKRDFEQAMEKAKEES